MERKEAIKVIKKNYPESTFTMLREALETLIPELKESEGERIRERIIALVNAHGQGMYKDEMTAWFEKQGKHANFLSKIQVGDKVTLNEDGVLVNLTQLKRVVNKGIENAIKEKQGEKPKVNLHVKCIANKVEPFDKYEGLTDFERTLTDICIGWIGEEPGWKQYIKDNADVLLKIAAKNFNSVQEAASEQKLAWSEEDKAVLDALIRRLEGEEVYISPHLAAEYLKSLKEKVLHQQQEWRKEDENMMQYVIDSIDTNISDSDFEDIKIWLKSLKDRVQSLSTWKPSDEQMKWFRDILDYHQFSTEGQKIMQSLYDDLKKLREE